MTAVTGLPVCHRDADPIKLVMTDSQIACADHENTVVFRMMHGDEVRRDQMKRQNPPDSSNRVHAYQQSVWVTYSCVGK